MRKIIRVALIMLLLAGAGLLMAQDRGGTMFVKTVPIMKIYSHPQGYKVIYVKSTLELGEFYLPLEWFTRAGGKAETIWGADRSYPYFSVFWREGRFDHIRLYLQEDMGHQTWGRLTGGEVGQKFQVDTLDLEF